MTYENIIFKTEENVAIIKFNRPKALNAINPALLGDVRDALEKIENDASVKVLILTGEGEKAFVAGADISYMVNLTPLQARLFSQEGHDLLFKLENLSIPVIACVNGFALGGGQKLPWHAILSTPLKVPSLVSLKLIWVSSPALEAPRGFPGLWERPWQKSFA